MPYIRNLFVIGLFLFTKIGIASNVDVMTQNQYLGADLAPVIAAAISGDLGALNSAVITALEQVSDNKTVERMEAQADLMSKRLPHFIGLQETYEFICSDPYNTGACEDPRIAGAFNNFLDLTLASLDGNYMEAATVVNFNATVPFDLYGTTIPAFVTVIDRDVILSRYDITALPVDFGCDAFYASVDGCNYMAALPPIMTPFGVIAVVRGYVGVDATIGDTDYRIVNTHLEVKDPPVPPVIQNGQALELMGVLAVTTPADTSLIVLGDMNSSPDEPLPSPYAQFIATGYTDAWTLRPGDVPGFTCCQSDNLSNNESELDDRIDMVFSRDVPVEAKKVRLLGDKVSSRTHPPGKGLWPSDHGAVATDLRF